MRGAARPLDAISLRAQEKGPRPMR
jgi:hypothetical protein